MSYSIDIYKKNPDNSQRYALGKSGNKPLIALGLNPSTADDTKPDMTISKILGFADRNGFDGFLMLNLYPQRATFPYQLDKAINKRKHQDNLDTIKRILSTYRDVNLLAAWGTPIRVRPYLIPCLLDIHNQLRSLNVNWLQIGSLTKSGHPRHPSRAAYRAGLQPFDLISYLNRWHSL